MVTPVYLKEESLRSWLQKVCNKYGDFKVCGNYIDKFGEKRWTKHKSVLECWSDDLKFLDTVSHRQVLPYEVILDLDDKESIAKKEDICDHLEELGEEFYCFSTGSKGYHIHIISKDICNLSDYHKKLLREQIYALSDIAFDELKASSKVMIAISSVPHWKSGKEKVLVRKSKWVN